MTNMQEQHKYELEQEQKKYDFEFEQNKNEYEYMERINEFQQIVKILENLGDKLEQQKIESDEEQKKKRGEQMGIEFNQVKKRFAKWRKKYYNE